MLARQSSRDYSSSWLMSDAAHGVFIERIEQEFAALPGGLAGKVEHEQNFVVTVGRLP
jgi:hypothetical protein